MYVNESHVQRITRTHTSNGLVRVVLWSTKMVTCHYATKYTSDQEVTLGTRVFSRVLKDVLDTDVWLFARVTI